MIITGGVVFLCPRRQLLGARQSSGRAGWSGEVHSTARLLGDTDLWVLSRFEGLSGDQRAGSFALPLTRRDQARGRVLWGGRAGCPAALSLALGSPAEAGPD